MPYTLAKFLLWGLLMALAGGVVGWLLRSLTARVQVAAARATTVDDAELDRLRGRLANLEPVVAERDRLRMELADVRGSTAGALGFAAVVEEPIIPVDDPLLDDGPPPAAPPIEREPSPAPAAVSAAPAGAGGPELEPDAEPTPEADAEPEPEPEPEVDVAEARRVLGRRVEVNDLTIVEGIGPKIAELCTAIGITTWRKLATADVATLQSMLDDAGSRFRMHKPGTWPRQGELLADGRWDDFKALSDELGGGGR
ncbi:MAG: hypothetical protein HKN44_07110 [Ilumatobacter sp.]|nr:hypothetical protein [Ilumatobacter sp.]